MLILLVVIVVAAVLFAVGAFIAGRLDGAVRWPPDAKPFPLPEGRLDARDVARARFGLAFRGYRMTDVDAALGRIAGELAARDAELDLLRGDRELPYQAGAETGDLGSPVRLSKGPPTGPPATPVPTGPPATPVPTGPPATPVPTGPPATPVPVGPLPEGIRPEPSDDA